MPRNEYEGLADRIRERFAAQGRVRSFWEYLDELKESPYRLLRSAPQYVRDMLDHYGAREVEVLGRATTRHKLFDGLPADPEQLRVVGQEVATDAIYRAIRNFATEGRATRLILLHGPNGSAKSTIADLIFRGLETYAETPEGVLYTFRWIFPKSEDKGGSLGFGSARASEQLDTYAYLEPHEISSAIPSDLNTNPIYLVPQSERAALLNDMCGGTPDFPHEHVLRGEMGTKSRAIYEALLTAYQGDWRRVMRHIRVERYLISRRYRVGAVTIEPQQANMDAESRQVTADLNFANLPPALQNLKLFEVSGDLVDANRGVVEYSDFLTRPLELNKYLLTTTEKATVRIPGALAYVDVVMVGSANEKHLDAFKADANFTSFKGRMELVTCPYLLEYEKEVEIYRDEIESIGRRQAIAPHAARTAALWAVLTRLWRPDPAHFDEPLRGAIPSLTPLAKALLYQGRDPGDLEDIPAETVRLFRRHLADIAAEYRDGVVFEGRFGASPREMKTILLDASYRTETRTFTPITIVAQLRKLVRDKTVYDFLKLEPKGLYNNPARFVDDIERAVVRQVMREIKDSMALVNEDEYDRRFDEYFRHVIAHTRKTTVTDARTGQSAPPSARVMEAMEKLVDTGEDVNLFRSNLISKVGAYSVSNPGARVDFRQLFPDMLRRLKEDFFSGRAGAVRQVEDALLLYETPGWNTLEKDRREDAERTLANLETRYAYPRECALEMTRFAIREARAIAIRKSQEQAADAEPA